MACLVSWRMPVAIRSTSQAKLQWLQPAENLFRCITLAMSCPVMQCAQLLPVGYSSFASQQDTYDSFAQTYKCVLHILKP